MASLDGTDEQLMAAYVDGDRQAFVVLFGRWAPRLRSLYVRSGLRSAEADDLVQQCFLHLHRARRDFRPGHALRPWLYTIAINLRREVFRRRGRKPEDELDLEVQQPTAKAGDPDAPLVAAVVRRALTRLPDAQREVIALHWFEGLSFPEVGEIVGASTTAVKVRAHRGYARLRAELEAVGMTAADLGTSESAGRP